MKFKLPGLGFLKRRKAGIDVEDLDEYEDFEADFGDDDEGDVAAPDSDGDIATETEPGDDEPERRLSPADDGYEEDGGGVEFDAALDAAIDDAEDEDEEGEGGGLKAKIARIMAPVSAALSGLRPKVEALLGTGKRRIAILSGAGVVALLLLGGLGWAGYALFAGGEPEKTAAEETPPKSAVELGEQLKRRTESLSTAEPGTEFGPREGEPGAETEGEPPPGEAPPGEGMDQTADAGQAPMPSLNDIARQQVSSDIAGVMVAAVPRTSYSRLPDATQGERALSDIPDPGLIEQRGPDILPRVDPAGRTSWQVYARPADPPAGKPVVAIVIGGLGLSRSVTEAATRSLPGTVTLAFEPYGTSLEAMVSRARQAGHEVLLSMPMASTAFPVLDAGPRALQIVLEPEENITRVQDTLAVMTRYIGVMGTMGSSIVTRDDMIRPVLAELKDRGLMYVDASREPKSLVEGIAQDLEMAHAAVSVVLDENPQRAAVAARLEELARTARREGVAVGLASAYPSTLLQLNDWFQSLPAQGITLVPVSALAER